MKACLKSHATNDKVIDNSSKETKRWANVNLFLETVIPVYKYRFINVQLSDCCRTRLTDRVRNSNSVVLEADVDVDARHARTVAQLASLVVQVDLFACHAKVNLKIVIELDFVIFLTINLFILVDMSSLRSSLSFRLVRISASQD